MKKQKGFTLIELLVVIAILGLLATLALVSLSGARTKARDARRLSDVKQIQTALEMYYSGSSTYPGTADNAAYSLSGDGYFTANLLKSVPTDPQSSDCTGATATYTYTRRALGQSYTIQYCLSAAAAGAPDSIAGINVASPASIADQ